MATDETVGLASTAARSAPSPRRSRRGDDEPAPDYSAVLSQQLWLAKLLAEEALRDDMPDDVSEISVATRQDDETSRLTRELMDNLDTLWSAVRAACLPIRPIPPRDFLLPSQ
jgi:hypothetical protein